MSPFPNFLSFSVGAACNGWANTVRTLIGQVYAVIGSFAAGIIPGVVWTPPNWPLQVCGALNIGSFLGGLTG